MQALRDEFYVDAGAMREAISQRSSFNLIHLKTMYKREGTHDTHPHRKRDRCYPG